MIHIRDYISTDLSAIAVLMGELGYPTSEHDMDKRMAIINSDPSYFTFVAEHEGIVAGMIGVRLLSNYEIDGPVTQISALVVHSEYKGRGIGRSLMGFVNSWSAEKGSSVLYLTSGMKEERKAAHKFYKGMGYEITGYRFVKLRQ
ncbi:GNAT family N-acetyltransferase [Paenibacillus sp. GCM10023252]|uniref:GNAT family N-acetyltransferase n=1 Tax=Paenibacillus sp. GCM10023252 TaxID=3252649 RepID=UPI00360BAF69